MINTNRTNQTAQFLSRTLVLSSLLLSLAACTSTDSGGVKLVDIPAPPDTPPEVPNPAVTIDDTNAFDLVRKATAASFAISDVTQANIAGNDTCDPTGTSDSTVKSSGSIFKSPYKEAASGVITLTDCGTRVSSLLNFPYYFSGDLNFARNVVANVDTNAISVEENISSDSLSLVIQDIFPDTINITGYSQYTTAEDPQGGVAGSYSSNIQFTYNSLELNNSFSVLATTPLSGEFKFFAGYASCPTSGVILVTGASGSQARATFNDDASYDPDTGRSNNDNTVLIEYYDSVQDKFVQDATVYICSQFQS